VIGAILTTMSKFFNSPRTDSYSLTRTKKDFIPFVELDSDVGPSVLAFQNGTSLRRW
jgi:hypothetical protein